MAVKLEDQQKTAEDIKAAKVILREIGTLNWASLDIDRGFIFVEDSGVSLRNVIVSPRKRGTIDITVDPATGLHEVRVTRFSVKKGTEKLHAWYDVPTSDLRRLLAGLWM